VHCASTPAKLAQIGIADLIVAEVEVSQRCALRQHSCKALCPSIADPIVPEVDVSQRCTLPQHSCKHLCPVCSNFIATEMKVHQLPALSQHSCKPLCPGCFEIQIGAEIKVRAAPGCHQWELPHHEL
jgi:hypothetical protein